MKRLFLSFFVVLCGLNVYAQGMGTSCNDAIFIDTAYTAALTEGDYWFTANTPALPLTIYIYPEDTTAAMTDIWLDLTCTPGVYDDPKVAEMISKADQYELSFPMLEKPEKYYDKDGNVYYSISFDTNYRDMLYEQGVTYPIPAFVHLKLYTNCSVDIKSTSINTQCRKYVNTWGLNTALRIAPADSANVYVWPIGDWIDKKYKITWESEGGLTMYDGKSCMVDRGQYVRNQYTMPKDEIIMTTARTSEWINTIYQTELYTRLYPEADGILRIMEYVEKSEITKYVVAGVNAVIDHDALTISATLPAGTVRNTAIKNAEVTYTAYNGETISYPGRGYKTLQFGSVKYDLNGIVVAQAEGSTDATLQNIEIDGYRIDGFSSSIATYKDVETDATNPLITATATDVLAKVDIQQATAVPGIATITVTAEAGNTQTYTIHFIKGRSRNTDLMEILVDGRPLPNFTNDEKYYRMEVFTLPVVTAKAVDPLAKIQILQALQVPGYAQISVTAEAGNVETYSINFSAHQLLTECTDIALSVAIDAPMPLEANSTDVWRFPVSEWSNEYLRFMWDQETPLTVYVGATCDFSIEEDDFFVVDSFCLAIPKGQTAYEYNLRPADFTRLAKLSVDGNLYVRFRHEDAGMLTLTRWSETCVTRGILIEPDATVDLAANAHNTIYKLYIDDYKDKDIRLTWTGNSTLTTYFAQRCDFNLTANNRYVLKPSPFNFAAGEDAVNVNTATWTEWKKRTQDGFVYLRCVNKAAGTLRFEVTNNYTPPTTDITNTWSELADNMRVVAGKGNVSIRSFANQDVAIYTLTGTCLVAVYLQTDEQTIISLPAGLYIIRGTQSAIKAAVR